MIGFRKSHAVVIGIDGYGEGIPPLRTAIHDATEIGRVLETGYGYSVHLLTEDVSLSHLKSIFGEFLPKEVEPDDRVFVYFAGHGIALDGDDGPAGYIIPQDARRQDKGSFLPMTDLNHWLDALPCRHLLLVLDCCFAGAYRWSSTRDLGALPEVIHRERFDRYIKDPAWQVITSAAYDQKALDVVAGEILGSRGGPRGHTGHSPFASAFLRALEKGEADLIPRGGPGKQGGDGVITATELYLYLRECVEGGAEADGHLQTPGLWPLRKHDKGEFIHLVPGHPLNLPPAPALVESSNPWRGLRSYDEEHADVFFGRSRFVATLADRVGDQPLTVVLGASGTGKSSAVKAGLLSRLRKTEPEAWEILPPIRPGKSPLASLAGISLPGEPADELDAHLADFRVDPEALARRIGAWAEREPGEQRLLLVIDQFEELITLSWDAGERDDIMTLLQRALAAHPNRLRVVLTLRSDFEPQFAHSPLEGDWMASRVVVPAMTLDEYREAIEGPASARVLYFKGKANSQEFINRLIGDVANTPGALPLLSFALSELYRRYLQRGGDDRALWEDDYEALGGVGGSLRNRADEVFGCLPDDAHRRSMRKVMLRMISIEGGELARRRVPDDELEYEDSDENGRIRKVVGRLTDARLVVEGKESDDQPFVEPAHDELVRGWDKLLRWCQEEAEGLQLRRRLTPAAQAWTRGHAGGWANDPRLRVLHQVLSSPENWLNATESRFIRRSWFWRRVGRVSITAAFLILCAITGFALYERNSALIRERIGNAGRLAGLSGQALAREPVQSLLLAKEAIRATRDYGDPAIPAAVQALYDATALFGGRPIFVPHRPIPVSEAFNTHRSVDTLAFGPDGWFVACGRDGDAVLGDLKQPTVRPRPLLFGKGHFAAESRLILAFAPDGRHVAWSSGKDVRVAPTNEPRAEPATMTGHKGDVTALAFAPDGLLVSASSFDGTLRVWNPDRPAGRPKVLGGYDTTSAARLTFRQDGRLATFSTAESARTYPPEKPGDPTRFVPDNPAFVWDLDRPDPHIGFHLRLIPSLAGDGGLPATGKNLVVVARRGGLGGLFRFRIFDAAGAMVVDTGEDNVDVQIGDLGDRLEGLWPPHDLTPGEEAEIIAAVMSAVRYYPYILPLRGHESAILALAFASDGRLVTGSGDGTLRVWNLAEPAIPPIIIREYKDPIPVMATSSDGRLATAHYLRDPDSLGNLQHAVRVWNLSRPGDAPVILPTGSDEINALMFTPDGRLVSGGSGKVARVWDLARRAEPLVLRGHEGPIEALRIAPDASLVTICEDQTARIWDLRNPAAQRLEFAGHEGPITALAVAPDGRIASGGQDKSVRVWNPKGRAAVSPVLIGHRGSIRALEFARDGRLVSADGDEVRVWDLKQPGSQPRVLPVTRGGISTLALLPDGRLVVGADERVFIHEQKGGFSKDYSKVNPSIYIWDLDRPEASPVVLREKDLAEEGAITALAVAPDGRIVTGGYDTVIRVWDAARPEAAPRAIKAHKSGVEFLAFAPDGRLLSVELHGWAYLWDLDKPNSGAISLPGIDDGLIARAFALAPDGRFFLGSDDATVRFWDLKNSAGSPTILRGNRATIRDIVVTPDDRLVTSNADGLVLVWNLNDFEAQPLVLTKSKSYMTGPLLKTTPDGRVITTGDDGKVKLWEIRLERLLEEADSIASRNLTYGEWRQFLGTPPYRRTFPNLKDREGVE